MRILIVEDTRTSSALLEAILRKAGYETVIASDGLEALGVLESGEGTDLVIADVQMPNLDGLGLMRRMRAHPEWKEIPVLICSGLDTLEVVQEANRLGSRGYILKPVADARRVVAKVEEVLGVDQPVLADEAQVRKQTGADEAAYAESRRRMSELVRSRIRLLEGIDQTRWNAEAWALADLIEVGSKAGAHRLVDFLRNAEAWEGGTRQFYERFLKELRALDAQLAGEGGSAEAPVEPGGPPEP